MYLCCRKLAQGSSMDDEGRDKDVSFAHRKDQEEVRLLYMLHVDDMYR